MTVCEGNRCGGVTHFGAQWSGDNNAGVAGGYWLGDLYNLPYASNQIEIGSVFKIVNYELAPQVTGSYNAAVDFIANGEERTYRIGVDLTKDANGVVTGKLVEHYYVKSTLLTLSHREQLLDKIVPSIYSAKIVIPKGNGRIQGVIAGKTTWVPDPITTVGNIEKITNATINTESWWASKPIPTLGSSMSTLTPRITAKAR